MLWLWCWTFVLRHFYEPKITNRDVIKIEKNITGIKIINIKIDIKAKFRQ